MNPGVSDLLDTKGEFTSNRFGMGAAGTGLERSPCPSGNSHILTTGAAKSGAPDAATQLVAAELLEVSAAWPELPAAIKPGILAIVRAGRGG